ncbi:hypothetical protein TNCV_172571 [Trichonephila clavipes]|nr:hypothetical protein TNCV_172571 [Trichonephila clavipes]
MTTSKTLKSLLEKQESEEFFERNGILYKYLNGRELIVTPKAMEAELIKLIHENGHFSVGKTEEIVKQEFFIPNLTNVVKKVIVNCVPCILVNKKTGKKEGFFNPISKESIPLSTYHVDFISPLPSTNKSYQHIFTVVDAFTKFTWLYPVKTVSAESALEKLKQQQKNFGNPIRIISDRGSAFTSKLFNDYCDEENIQHLQIATGVPRGNGQVERIHRTLIPVLTKLSLDDSTKWYKYVDRLQRILNSTICRSTKWTPFELLVGTKMRNKEDILIKDLLLEEMAKELLEQRELLRNDAKKNIETLQSENRKTYNRRRKKASLYKEDDLVAIQRTQFGAGLKLRPKFLGPHKVTKVNSKDRRIHSKEKGAASNDPKVLGPEGRSLGYTLDQEITSNKHIEGQVIKTRKRLNVLKFISGRDWGVEASTLRTTFISLIRPVLEFGIPIYSCASDTNLNKLERVQLCAARIITGLRHSCQIDIVLFESNLPSFSKRRLYSLTSVTKSSEIPALVNQLALETINGIPQSSLKIYTDGSRGEKGISGSGVYIPTSSGALEFKIKNPNYCSVFRSELIAIRRGLQCAAQLEDRFQEIWILTDSRASIQHLANWGDIGDQTSLDILSLLHYLSSGHSIHFQWIPLHVSIEGNERADFLASTAAVEGVSPRGNLTFSEISTIPKLELNRQIKTPPSHAWYFAKCPGASFRLSSRPLQSTYSRFLSGHTQELSGSLMDKGLLMSNLFITAFRGSAFWLSKEIRPVLFVRILSGSGEAPLSPSAGPEGVKATRGLLARDFTILIFGRARHLSTGTSFPNYNSTPKGGQSLDRFKGWVYTAFLQCHKDSNP